MPGSTGSTSPSASRGRSSRQPAGRTRGASSSSWRRLNKAPIAIEAVRRIDALFAIEREINGKPAEERLAVRGSGRPLVPSSSLAARPARRVSRKSEIGKAIAYSLNRWTALTRFLEDGRICMTNNAAERALRGIAVGRRNWTFAGSDRGGERAAAIYTLIETAKLNDVDPQAWLADSRLVIGSPSRRRGAV